jgi:hypothetical protein
MHPVSISKSVVPMPYKFTNARSLDAGAFLEAVHPDRLRHALEPVAAVTGRWAPTSFGWADGHADSGERAQR